VIAIAEGEPLYRVPPARNSAISAQGIEADGRDAKRLGSQEPGAAKPHAPSYEEAQWQ